MHDERGRWIGFAISGLCLGLILIAVASAVWDAPALQILFGDFCHQIDDRCYHIYGVALPVCVRCVWIYFGLATGHILFLYWKPASPGITRTLIGVIALMLFDVLLEKVGLYHNLFWTRALSGFLFGCVVAHFTLLGLREIYNELTNPITYVRSKYFSSRSR